MNGFWEIYLQAFNRPSLRLSSGDGERSRARGTGASDPQGRWDEPLGDWIAMAQPQAIQEAKPLGAP